MSTISVVIQTILDTPMDVLDQVARTAMNDRLPLEYLTTLGSRQTRRNTSLCNYLHPHFVEDCPPRFSTPSLSRDLKWP
jgi:hypothetical protein